MKKGVKLKNEIKVEKKKYKEKEIKKKKGKRRIDDVTLEVFRIN